MVEIFITVAQIVKMLTAQQKNSGGELQLAVCCSLAQHVMHTLATNIFCQV